MNKLVYRQYVPKMLPLKNLFIWYHFSNSSQASVEQIAQVQTKKAATEIATFFLMLI